MDVAVLALTAALVAVTCVYAYFTAMMVREQRAARLLRIPPNIALEVEMRSGLLGEIAVLNLGPGHAMKLDLNFTFEPLPEKRSWSAFTLLAGHERRLLPPRAADTNRFLPVEELATQDVRVRVRGAMHDVLGGVHEVDEEIVLAGWWERATAAHERLVHDPLNVIAEEPSRLRRVHERPNDQQLLQRR